MTPEVALEPLCRRAVSCPARCSGHADGRCAAELGQWLAWFGASGLEAWPGSGAPTSRSPRPPAGRPRSDGFLGRLAGVHPLRLTTFGWEGVRVEIQLSMLILEVRDLARSIAFYRGLGLDLPDPVPGRPVVIHRMGSGVSLLLTTSFAATYDPAWTRPDGGYQQLLEFYVGDDASVDQLWAGLVAAGHPSRLPPTQTAGPYAAMVDDPDGNVVLLTSDEAARVDNRLPGTDP